MKAVAVVLLSVRIGRGAFHSRPKVDCKVRWTKWK